VETSVYLASSPEVEGVSGRYFAKKAEARSSDASHEEGIARRLCEASIELTKVPAKKPAIVPRLSLDGPLSRSGARSLEPAWVCRHLRRLSNPSGG
jgi:hypothetical protein